MSFSHRGGQWRDAVTGHQAVAYRLRFDPQARGGRGGWYLTAVFAPPEPAAVAADDTPQAAAATTQAGPVVGVACTPM